MEGPVLCVSSSQSHQLDIWLGSDRSKPWDSRETVGKLRYKLPGALTDNTENFLIPGERATVRFPLNPALCVIPKVGTVKSSQGVEPRQVPVKPGLKVG